MNAPLRRRLALAAIALGLVAGGSLVSASAAQAVTYHTKTVVWFVPAGFAHRFDQPQILVPSGDPVGCGDFQVDVYRYTTPGEIAFVNALVATGVLHGASEDSPVYLSNTDVVSTATCAPTPVAHPAVTPQLPSTACVPPSAGAETRTASFTLNNTASTETVTFTVNGTPYSVAAGVTRTVAGLPVAATGTTFTITAAGSTWSFPVAHVVTCAVSTPVSPPKAVTPPATVVTTHATTPAVRTVTPATSAAPPRATVARVAPAATTVTPAAAPATAATTTATTALAYTGSAHTGGELAIAGLALATGLGLLLLARRRRAPATGSGAVPSATGGVAARGIGSVAAASGAAGAGVGLASASSGMGGGRLRFEQRDAVRRVAILRPHSTDRSTAWTTGEDASSWWWRSSRRSSRSSTGRSSP
ncbi:hypothetical protein [Frondihabitans australicus]|uniref:LPXTG-motif cell wall-anchored protein n=1 Tax=Frondihabitans australicus TaxID=386892 RepID=A0A495IF00_9MICO|nr:hypothetical protein [Frondihabitans australicus]RKR74562.1 LPXTG-motif cell wall-anchored protein [Frondihabitans australicus]